ncbi:sigma-70 family RNA polymerase sigma factor [Planctomicrobium sp. SH664]|uniref:sigma-70 family RNA polymerase sigma factor n=1 Tax=Planctomicrobium sp. SH664 TaxID=3448125 RepID=UPI003F5C7A28
MPPHLDELIRRTQAGDVNAFTEVVRAYQRELRGWLIARCPPEADADSLAQEVFLDAFHRIGEFTPGTDFRAWIFAICRYRLLGECTRIKRRLDYRSKCLSNVMLLGLENRIQDEEPLRLDYLRECLANLAQPVRELLEWRYRDELSLIEIAARANRSLAATKKSLSIVRAKLRECVLRRLSLNS